jgi:hypothetical protein
MRVQTSNESKSASTAPVGSLSDWWPMVSPWALSESLRQNCVELNSAWQAFVGHRVQEDLHLLQELASAKATAEMWSAYCRFWQKAVEDYAAAYGQMIKLGSGFIKSGAMINGSAVESPPQRSKAA